MTRRKAAVSVFCLLLGLSVGAMTGSSRAQGTSAGPTIRQSPAIAKDFTCAAYDGMAVRHTEPLRTYAVPAKDLEIRVWRGNGSATATAGNSTAGNLSHGQNGFAPGPWLIGQGLVLRRRGGVWSGERLTGNRASLQAVGFVVPITRPDGGWDKLWGQLEAEGILTLPDQPQTMGAAGKAGDAPVAGFDSYLIETNDGGVYRGSFYDSPEYNRRQEDRQVAGILRTLHDSLYSVSEARLFWQEAVAPLPIYAQNHLMQDTFSESHAVGDLPEWVKKTFEQAYPGAEFTMANPGEAFPVGSAASGESPFTSASPPLRRLSFLAVSGDYCVVAYEYKASHYGQKTLLFHKADAPSPFAADVYQATSEIRLVPKDLREVRALQSKGRFLQVQEESF